MLSDERIRQHIVTYLTEKGYGPAIKSYSLKKLQWLQQEELYHDLSKLPKRHQSPPNQ